MSTLSSMYLLVIVLLASMNKIYCNFMELLPYKILGKSKLSFASKSVSGSAFFSILLWKLMESHSDIKMFISWNHFLLSICFGHSVPYLDSKFWFILKSHCGDIDSLEHIWCITFLNAATANKTAKLFLLYFILKGVSHLENNHIWFPYRF